MIQNNDMHADSRIEPVKAPELTSAEIAIFSSLIDYGNAVIEARERWRKKHPFRAWWWRMKYKMGLSITPGPIYSK